MIIKTILVAAVFIDLFILYRLSVALDRVEDDIVDIEITYTKLQSVLRSVDDTLRDCRQLDLRDKLPFE